MYDLKAITYSDFLALSKEDYRRWWLLNTSLWLQDPFGQDLFIPMPEVIGARDHDIFTGIKQAARNLPVSARYEFQAGLCSALDYSLGQADMSLSAVLIRMATELKANTLQQVAMQHLNSKNTRKWFDPCFNGVSSGGSVFDSLLHYASEVPSADYSKHLLELLDQLFLLRWEKARSYERAQELFLHRLRLEQEERLPSLTEQFIERVNALLKGNHIKRQSLLFRVRLLLLRLNVSQIRNVLKSALNWQCQQEDSPSQVEIDLSFSNKSPKNFKDDLAIDWFGAPWLFGAIKGLGYESMNERILTDEEQKPQMPSVLCDVHTGEESTKVITVEKSAVVFYDSALSFFWSTPSCEKEPTSKQPAQNEQNGEFIRECMLQQGRITPTPAGSFATG